MKNRAISEAGHSIGNGEVDSSILSGSTITTLENKRFSRQPLHTPPRLDRELRSNVRPKLGEISGSLFSTRSRAKRPKPPPDPEKRSRRRGGSLCTGKSILQGSPSENGTAVAQAQHLRRLFALPVDTARVVAELAFKTEAQR